MASRRRGATILWLLVALLILLRQDFWFWTDPSLVFGILPVGLVWHMGISIAAAVLWYLATRFAWPVEMIDEVHAMRGEVPERTS